MDSPQSSPQHPGRIVLLLACSSLQKQLVHWGGNGGEHTLALHSGGCWEALLVPGDPLKQHLH